MEMHEQNHFPVQATIDTLRNSLGSGQNGVIEQWQQLLRNYDQASDIVRTLGELKNGLQQENPDPKDIQVRMDDLAQAIRLLSTRTDLGSELHDQLNEMATGLRNASIQLNQYHSA